MHAPIPRGEDPVYLQVLASTYAHAVTHINQVLHGDQTDDSVFRGPHAPTLVNIFVTPLLTRDLYAVANLLISHFTQHSIVIFCTTCYRRFQKEKPPLSVMCKAEIYRYYWCYDYETNSLKTWHN